MVKRNWVYRTIRNGVVRIDGVDYYPEKEYDGRLDGMRFLFGRYYICDSVQPFIYLWGTEQMARDKSLSCENEPNLFDGYFHWLWWRSAPATAPDSEQE